MTAQIIRLNEQYNFLKISNFLKEYELNEIWNEINFLSYRSKFDQDTNTARNPDGELKSNKIGVWLDLVYSNRKYSNYFKFYQKWLTDETKNYLLESSFTWRHLYNSYIDTTLLSYYEDGTYYEEHSDTSKISQLFWTFKHPKKFKGGQFEFTDFNHKIEIEDNTLVVFPSFFNHKVNPVDLIEKTPDNQDKFLCNGRYVFSTFYS